MPGSSQIKSGLPVKSEKDILLERSHSPGAHSASLLNQPSKHQVKALHPSQERGSLMYQPLVGSGGAFKPYEYSSNSSSPAPPAHQNTSPALSGRMGTPQYQLQDQPQNLVKGDGKTVQDRMNSSHKYDPRDKQTVSTATSLPACFSPPYSSSKSLSPAANTTHSLIQQGLVPNPMYIAATHTGNNTNSSTPPVSFVHSQTSSKPPVHAGSPPVSQQYAHVNLSSGITSGAPVCRPSSVPYSLPPGRTNRSYSPVGPPTSLPMNVNNTKVLVTHDHPLSSRPHLTVQSGSHRSPSPAHLYGSQSNPGAPSSPHQSSPRLTSVSNHPAVHLSATNTMPSSPFHSSSQSENQDISMMSGVPLVKRKLINDVAPRKRPKSIDDGLLPPQLQPQVQTSNVESSDGQVIAPPNLVSNVVAERQQGTETLPAKSDPPSPIVSANLVFKSGSTATPPSMPDLTTPSVSSEALELNSGIQNSISVKCKIPFNMINNTSSFTEENSETSANSCVPSTSEKLPTSFSNTVETSDERSATSPAVSNSNITPIIRTNHPKLKKAWLQRHSENEDKKNPNENSTETKIDPPIKTESESLVSELNIKSEPYVLLENSICDEVLTESKLRICEDSSSDVSENRTNKSDRTVDDEDNDSSSSESDTDPDSKSGKRKTKIKSKTSGLKRVKGGSNSDAGTDDQPSPKKDGKKKNADKSFNSKKRGRKKVRNAIIDENSKKKAGKLTTELKF